MEYPDPNTTPQNNHPHPPSHSHAGENNIDMDIMHDFGEGVGVDMRDFAGGAVGGEEEEMGVGGIGEDLHKSCEFSLFSEVRG